MIYSSINATTWKFEYQDANYALQYFFILQCAKVLLQRGSEWLDAEEIKLKMDSLC